VWEGRSVMSVPIPICDFYFLYFLSNFSENTVKKYPGRIIKIAMKTFQMFIKTKSRSTRGSLEIIRFRQYDNNMKEMAIFIQVLPTVFNMFGILFICNKNVA
jgi:hypothetical protein